MNNEPKLTQLLELEQIEANIFRGDSRDIGSLHVFGGQVLGQALNAASRTVSEDKFTHSMHAYFILPGNMEIPIIYEVDRIRDGGSFTTRRVVAIQNGKAIFNMSASFQKEEDGIKHQDDMPTVAAPDKLVTMESVRKQVMQFVPEKFKRYLKPNWPIEVRLVDDENPFLPTQKAPNKQIWFRAIETLPNNPELHKCVLAYASDFNLLTTAMLPHNISFGTHNLQVASLDHAIWFHRPFNANEWLFYDLHSPSASNARGFCLGSIYNQQGLLVASVAQEGLIRIRT